MVKFISYSGEWPCLCFGTLVIEVDGKRYDLDGVLVSGGWVRGSSPDWNFEITTGDWKVNENFLPDEIKKYKKEIEEVVNMNVEKGCCGGCI